MADALSWERGLHVPIFSYLLVVGSVLTGLLFYAPDVMMPSSSPISVSQKTGLPEPYKAPAVAVEVAKPGIVLATVEPPVKAKKAVKAVGKTVQTRVVRDVVPQGRYAAYPPREHERDLAGL